MDEEQQPLMDTMSIEDARVVWLTMLGSDWVDQSILMDAPMNSPLDAASIILDYESLLEFDHYQDRVRIKCKS